MTAVEFKLVIINIKGRPIHLQQQIEIKQNKWPPLGLTDWGAPLIFLPPGDHIFAPLFSQSACSSLKLR